MNFHSLFKSNVLHTKNLYTYSKSSAGQITAYHYIILRQFIVSLFLDLNLTFYLSMIIYSREPSEFAFHIIHKNLRQSRAF